MGAFIVQRQKRGDMKITPTTLEALWYTQTVYAIFAARRHYLMVGLRCARSTLRRAK